MKLIVLGSGTCVPSLTRNSPGYCLEAEGCMVLVDCGSGTLLQLERAGKSYKEIDAIFITHRHPDHFADLMPLIHALFYTPGFKRRKDLHIVASAGFISYYEKAVASILGPPQDFSIHMTEIDDKFDLGPFNVFAKKTVHSPDSLAYRFEHDDRSAVFTGDADYEQGLITFSKKAGLLIADCSFPDAEKVKGHLTSGECGLIAQKAGVRKLLLSHIYPSDIPDTGRVSEAQGVYKGEVILAEDLMQIEI